MGGVRRLRDDGSADLEVVMIVIVIYAAVRLF